jgi:hypothetical protein
MPPWLRPGRRQAAGAAERARARERATHPRALPASVASQYFLTRTDVTYVNISQNFRQKGRNGRAPS